MQTLIHLGPFERILRIKAVIFGVFCDQVSVDGVTGDDFENTVKRKLLEFKYSPIPQEFTIVFQSGNSVLWVFLEVRQFVKDMRNHKTIG
jgi:hypothetical protein